MSELPQQGADGVIKIEGPSPAFGVALDLAKRGVWLMPVLAIISMLFWGLEGVASTAYGLLIVVANFLLSAYLLAVTGRISATWMAGAALFGFFLRLGLIAVAVLLVRDASWIELVPLGLTLIISHLVLLFWELRYVSGSLAFPGVKPNTKTPNPYLPNSSTEADSPAAAGSAPADATGVSTSHHDSSTSPNAQ